MRSLFALLTLCSLCLAARAQDNPDDLPESEGNVRLTLDTGGHTSNIARAFFTPDSQQLITLANDQTIRIWDVESGECLQVLYPPHRMHAHTARLSPDGQRLAVGRDTMEDGKRHFGILVISLAEGRIEKILSGLTTVVTSLTFTPDGKRVVFGSGDKSGSTISVWNLDQEENKPERTFTTPGIPQDLAFSPNGSRLAQSGEWSGILDFKEGKVVRKLFAGGAGERVAWSHDGKSLAFGTDHGVRLWDPDNKERAQVDMKNHYRGVCFSANSATVLAAEYWNDNDSDPVKAFLYDAMTGNQRGKKPFVGDPVKVRPMGKPGTESSRVHLVNENFLDCALSPDGKFAATVGRANGSHQVLIWHLSDRTVAKRLVSRAWLDMPNGSVAWSTDGKTVTWNQDKSARGFHLEDLKLTGAPAKTAPPLVDVQDTLHLSRTSDTEFWVQKDKSANPPFKIGSPRSIPQATFFGKDRVVISGMHFLPWDITAKKKLPALEGHTAWVDGLACSPRHQYLASVGWDQVLCIHTTTSTKPLMSLYVAAKQWVAWTPEGYYASSPNGDRLMGWVIESSADQMCTFYPALRFHSRLYRPDVIALLHKEGSLKEALKKADEKRPKPTKIAKVDDLLPPKVDFKTTPEFGKVLKDGKLHIDATAEAQGEDPITALQLLIDDRPYADDKGLITLPKPEKGPVTVKWDVELTPGPHDVRIVAKTEASLGTSRGMKVDADPDKVVAKKELPMLYLLAIGVDSYPAPLTLKGAVNDATELVKVLTDHSRPLPFRDIETKLCVMGNDVKKAGILEGFKWLKVRQKPGDVAMIFYAGHGDRDKKGEFYLLPQDVNTKDLEHTGLSRTEIKQLVKGMPGRILVMLDACHSAAVGLLFDDVSDVTGDLSDEDCGVVVICAAHSGEYALEKGHGFLTLSVIEALTGNVPPEAKTPKVSVSRKDSCVYLHHLQTYIIDRVEELSQDKQHPTAVMPPWMRSFGLSKP